MEREEGGGGSFGLREEGVSRPMFFDNFAFVGRGRSSSGLSSIRKMSSKKRNSNEEGWKKVNILAMVWLIIWSIINYQFD